MGISGQERKRASRGAQKGLGIQLRIGRKAGVLIVTVTDAGIGVPLGSVRYELAWADDAKRHLWFETSGYPRPPFTLLLPSNIDVTLTVISPAHKMWSYPGVINVGPGQELPLDVQLQPGPANVNEK